MDGMTRTNTLSQCRVRHYHKCGQTRENVTCEDVLFTSFGLIKNIPLNCLALSSFGFSIAHLFLLSSLLHQTYASTYLAIHRQDER